MVYINAGTLHFKRAHTLGLFYVAITCCQQLSYFLILSVTSLDPYLFLGFRCCPFYLLKLCFESFSAVLSHGFKWTTTVIGIV
jgi:hypothetical protein